MQWSKEAQGQVSGISNDYWCADNPSLYAYTYTSTTPNLMFVGKVRSHI